MPRWTATTRVGVTPNTRPRRSNENAFEIHLDGAVDFLNRENLKRFRSPTAGTGLQTELMAVHRADHLATAKDSFGQRAPSMRASIMRRKDPAVPLTEYGEILASNH